MIKELNVTNGRVALWVGSGLLGNPDLSVKLPDIHLKDIGKDSGGASVPILAMGPGKLHQSVVLRLS